MLQSPTAAAVADRAPATSAAVAAVGVTRRYGSGCDVSGAPLLGLTLGETVGFEIGPLPIEPSHRAASANVAVSAIQIASLRELLTWLT